MAKQAFKFTLQFPDPILGSFETGTPHTYNETNKYIVPQNKRLVFRVLIPHKTTKTIMGYMATALTQNLTDIESAVSIPLFLYDIPGFIKITPNIFNDSVHNINNELPNDLITPVLITPAGSEIKFKVISSEWQQLDTYTIQFKTWDNAAGSIISAAYINGFLEDDV